MTRLQLEFQNVLFSYDNLSTPLFKKLTLQLTSGWTGVIGGNGVGKTTFLKLSTGRLQPVSGMILRPQCVVYCRQTTDEAPDNFRGFMASDSREAYTIRGKLGIEDGWIERWTTLSHGERKRAQIGCALWQDPELLAIDEPSNHLDTEARCMLAVALQAFRGIGLLVTHDKTLMDALCRSCLYIDPPEAMLRRGDFSSVFDQIRMEEETARQQHEQANREFRKLDREFARRREVASQADNKRSKRHLDKKDSDGRFRMNVARLTGKDATAGRLMNQLAGRRQQARNVAADIQIKKQYELGIWQSGECSRRSYLFRLPAGELALGNGVILSYPDLDMRPSDRIAILGANGAGKSSLIKTILGIVTVDPAHMTYLSQELDLKQSRAVLEEARQLPGDQLGKVMTIVNRLGTRPPRLLESRRPSPGEIRKMMLALGVVRTPHLIIMDEPTNHLDLFSIEALKTALMDYPAGLLLVSHDMAFLDGLVDICWRIRAIGRQPGRYVLNVD